MLIRNPSPPIASIAWPIRSATVSGEPTKSTSDPGAPNRSMASWRSVFPVPHWANLSSDPCSPLVVSRWQRLVEVELREVDVGDGRRAGQRAGDEMR
ncbi:MAG: hypothetical protein WDN25_15060 [Acetobacteraceae bacterium]